MWQQLISEPQLRENSMRIPFFTSRKNVAARSIPAPQPSHPRTPLEMVMDYHEQTKHQYYRFARSLGYLDWDNQPNPFRRFEGTLFHRLPLLPIEDFPAYDNLFEMGSIASQPVSEKSLSQLFRNSLAITAWKSYEGTRWALRVNPSSGNLHPTEGYVILNTLDSGITAGVYHYVSVEHGLERRATLSPDLFRKLMKDFPIDAFLVGFTSIHWREAWKYGERAYRYCQHDLGHAIGSMRLSAALLGWQMLLLEELADQDVASFLGLTRNSDFHEAEDEYPHVLAAIIPSLEVISQEARLSEEAMEKTASGVWHGHANRLSESHVEWSIIDEVARNAAKDRTRLIYKSQKTSINEASATNAKIDRAAKIIQQRRSALGLDRSTFISAESFYHILSRTLPDFTPVPFDVFTRSVISSPRIHLAIFVTRVNGLSSGCYVLVRDPQKLETLKSSMYAHFEWTQPKNCPKELPLYRLEAADVGPIAAGVSCGQDIAGDGVFSLGMIAEFEEPLRQIGPWLYPRFFWEAGFIGQILYLEAEAAGIRATGIGCYFDDQVHETFGLKDKKFQSLYHFTMGGPVEDERLTTDPPYSEEVVRASQTKMFNPDLP
jgi:SagB-type dehydrogenase family enzyme